MEYIEAKKIVMNNKRLNWDYMVYEYYMNIYWGCPHGCIYCYARSDYYDNIGNLGGRFDCVRAKKNALEIIRNDLRSKVKKGVVCMGGMSDPYNPEEKRYQLTRHSLELLHAFEFGACFLTKSALATRDTDILTDIKEHSPVSIGFSITCSDDTMCRKIEPNVSTTTERFQAIKHLSDNGIITGVFMDPLLPYITDTKENVQEMVKKAVCYGAKFIYLSTQVTMADGQREYFYREAEKNFPGISERYQNKFKTYYYCKSPVSRKLWDVFTQACAKEGISCDMRAVNQMIRRGYDISALSYRDDTQYEDV